MIGKHVMYGGYRYVVLADCGDWWLVMREASVYPAAAVVVHKQLVTPL
jgi:hypothetical protein